VPVDSHSSESSADEAPVHEHHPRGAAEKRKRGEEQEEQKRRGASSKQKCENAHEPEYTY